MRYITEIMATGQKSSETLEHGIEINRLKILSNYIVLKIFWESKTNSKVSETIFNIKVEFKIRTFSGMYNGCNSRNSFHHI